MTEQAKVPAIRFAGFTDPWEQRKLGDYVVVSTAKNADGRFNKEDVLSVSGEYGIVNQIAFQGRSFAGSSVLNYGIVNTGDIVYTKSPLNSNPYGIIKVNKGIPGIVSTLYAVYRPQDNVHTNFIQVYFEQHERMNNYMHPLVNKGAKNDMKVTAENALKGVVTFPSREEQVIISEFFDRLDSLITLHQRKYDKLVVFKKSMLEKMFPKDGESVPEIRFAGFTDPWEQRKLGEIVSIGAGAPPSAFSAGNFLYVKVDDLNESSHFQFDSAQRVDANTAVKPIRKGSIIFAKRGAAILGNKVRVLGKTAYIDTNMMALEPRGVDADFLWLFINQTGLYRIADTSTIPQINNKHIEPYPVDIPNMAEQQAIGTFFSRLDDLITLHQRKLELLQNIKKSLLDKMFV
ncbi:restriction endonuclease subunit S [Bifidobacterium longum]|uniref:restriction endonuclease subunit S n=1 Tax=Bifidobacterium longum TaxID=216816 RepID=UPI003F651690